MYIITYLHVLYKSVMQYITFENMCKEFSEGALEKKTPLARAPPGTDDFSSAPCISQYHFPVWGREVSWGMANPPPGFFSQ